MIWITLAATTLILLLGAVNLLAFKLLYKKLSRETKALTEEIAHIRTDIRALKTPLAGVGKKLVNVEKRFQSVIESTRELSEIAQSEPAESAYQTARELLKRGAKLEEVIRTCGLTRAEVELLRQIRQGSEADDEQHYTSYDQFASQERARSNNLRRNLRTRS